MKALRQGYYWPTMQRDALDYVRKCDKCQRFATVPHAPPEMLTSMTSPWPFAVWGIDLIGSLPTGTGGVKYVVVAVDYFTKWVEAEPLSTITSKRMVQFCYKNIVCRYGIPNKIVSDNGLQFDSAEFRKFCDDLDIKKGFSAVIHPQANGQVEAVNKILKQNLKTKLDEHKGAWAEELPNILWAYRTTAKTTTGETPFSLAYGYEAMIPVEVGLSSLRRLTYNQDQNQELQRIELDLIEEKRDQSQLKIASYQQRTARYYNSKVRNREFKLGDLVLRKVTPNTEVRGAGVLGPTWEGPYRIAKIIRPGSYKLQYTSGEDIPRAWNAESLRKYYQ